MMFNIFNILNKLNLLIMIIIWIVILTTLTIMFFSLIKNKEENIEKTEDNKIKDGQDNKK